MKRVGKPVFCVILVLVLAFTVLNVAGLHTQYGDITSTKVKGIKDIPLGTEIGGSVEVIYSASDRASASAEEMRVIQDVLEDRLMSLYITDYDIYSIPANASVVVRIPWDEKTATFDLDATIDWLGRAGNVEIYSGSGDAADLVNAPVVTSKNLKKASLESTVNPQTGYYSPVVLLQMDGKGSKILKEAITNPDLQDLSFWIDGVFFSSSSTSAIQADGSIAITGFNSTQETNEMIGLLNSGGLPFELNADYHQTFSPTTNPNWGLALSVMAIVSAVLVCLFLLIRYRVPGASAVVMLVGQFALILASVSGFFPKVPALHLSFAVVAGAVFSLGLGVYANLRLAEQIKEEVKGGKSIDSAVSAGFAKTSKNLFASNALLFVLLLAIMGAFALPGGFFPTILKPFFFFTSGRLGSFYAFAYTAMAGIVANVLMNLLVNRLFLGSLVGMASLRKSKNFGGERE